MLLLFFFLSLGLYLLFTVVELMPRIWNLPISVSEKSKPILYSLTRTLIGSLKLISTVGFGWVIYTTANERQIGVVFLILLIVALIASMGGYFFRSFRLSLEDAREALKQGIEGESQEM